jgi:hypothetical protein
MECWNLGLMGLKKPVFKTHIISYFHAQYSTIPQFDHFIRLIKKMAVKNTVIPINCRNSDAFNYSFKLF